MYDRPTAADRDRFGLETIIALTLPSLLRPLRWPQILNLLLRRKLGLRPRV